MPLNKTKTKQMSFKKISRSEMLYTSIILGGFMVQFLTKGRVAGDVTPELRGACGCSIAPLSIPMGLYKYTVYMPAAQIELEEKITAKLQINFKYRIKFTKSFAQFHIS